VVPFGQSAKLEQEREAINSQSSFLDQLSSGSLYRRFGAPDGAARQRPARPSASYEEYFVLLPAYDGRSFFHRYLIFVPVLS
jgi:hypothetical protein